MRVKVHYLCAATILAVYGVAVCPFIESLGPLQLILPIVVAFALQYVARRQICHLLDRRVAPKSRSARYFATELLLFIVVGSLLMTFNTLYYDFPLESGMKIVVGMLALGFFVAIDLSLEIERTLFLAAKQGGELIEPDNKFMPVTRKISWFASLSVVTLLVVVFLVINKDLDWLISASIDSGLADARRAIIAELSFIIAVTLPYLLTIIASYARNLRLFLDAMNGLLAEVSSGQLEGSVPVSSNDEFGVMASGTNQMVVNLKGLTEQLCATRDVTILSLAILAEKRDNETGAHIMRTQHYVKALAQQLRDHPRFKLLLDDGMIDLLFKSAPLHDIGKVGITDAILLKPGRHTPEEFEIMKTHVMIGGDALRRAEEELGQDSFLSVAREIAEGHHEKWDGSGYPRSLSGESIPAAARLMAVADVYDALISKRVYKPAYSHHKAVEIVREGRGNHFDPDVVDAFLAIEGEIVVIAQTYRDELTRNDEVAAPVATQLAGVASGCPLPS